MSYVPLISSGTAGPLGVLHLPRLWQKVTLEYAGKLAAGYEADIIALDGDPLKDLTAVRRVVFVMRGGVIYKSPGASSPTL